MKVSFNNVDGLTTAVVSGRLDANSAPEFETKLVERIAQDGGKLILDLNALEYVSSAGLRVFLVAAKRCQQHGGKLALFGLGGNVREVFEISGFSSVFKTFPDEASAKAGVED